MAYFAGLRGTGSFGTDERPKNFREMILFNNPNGKAPLFALTARMKKETTNDPEFSWWEEVNDIGRATVNGAVAQAGTTITVDPFNATTQIGGALQFAPGDLLLVEGDTTAFDQEVITVVSVTNDTTLVVTRGSAGTTAPAGATSIPDNAGLLRIGSAHAEGTGAPSSVSSNPVKYVNKTQIFKTTYELTGTAKETYLRTGDPMKNDQLRKSFIHSEKLEQAFLWGRVSETTSGGQPLRTMAGLRSMIQSNVKVYTADPTLDSFINDLSPVFDYESGAAGDERVVYAGNGAINHLNKLIASDSSTRINYDGIIDVYGQRMLRFTIPQGTIAIKSHPLMNVHPLYTYSMFVVNPSGLVYRPLKNRDTKPIKNVQLPDEDKQKDMWLTECSLELHYERSFAYIGQFKDFP